MSFQVVNGSIPQAVERFLREVVRLRLVDREGMWELTDYPSGDVDELFDWPHDREPTLQEAIEAVVFQREGA